MKLLAPISALLVVLAAPLAPAQIVNRPPVPEWITAPNAHTNETVFFQRAFLAPKPLLKSVLLAAAEGHAELLLNGQSIGIATNRTKAVSIDITSRLKPGATNLLAARAVNPANLAAVALLLELNGDLSRQSWLISDTNWSALPLGPNPEWITFSTLPPSLPTARSLGRADSRTNGNPFSPDKAIDAYNSWKLALANNQSAATDPATFTLLPGFRAELIRSATTNEGSWVALAFDPRGRLTLAREKRGLLRLTFAAPALSQRREPPAATVTTTSSPAPEVSRVEVINDTLLECRGLLYAHGALFANANNTKALFRLRDTQGNDQFDEITELLRTDGGVGHGRNHLKLGPDGWLWIAHGNNVLLPKNLSTNSPLRNYAHDRLIPNPWDAGMFDGNVQLPAGHILRVKPDGSEVQLYAGGFRNPLDLAFNHHGDLFTFDADMEWDVGTPWYMPNRVLHVLPGADFGWRRGASRFPAWFADTLPSVVDIGLASPTGVTFGYDARFPDKYRRAFFISDWAYGRILAVHLTPTGSTYTGSSELFISGRPLNVTDVAIGPDGALWFTTGGRGTQSGLYRVSYTQPVESARFAGEEITDSIRFARQQRHWLELATVPKESNPSHAYTNTLAINNSDPRIVAARVPDRSFDHAQRTAYERLPIDQLREFTFANKRPAGFLNLSLALIRASDTNSAPRLLERFTQLPFPTLTEDQQLTALRVLSLVFIRLGAPTEAQRQACLHWLEPLYPNSRQHVNHALIELLVYLRSPNVIAKTIPLLANASASEDLVQYPFYLRYVTNGWTLDARRTVFKSLARAELLPGARQYFKALQDIRKEMLAVLTPAERDALAPELAPAPPKPVAPAAPAVFVKNWKLEDLLPRLAEASRGRSWEGARTAFVQGQCILCHRVSADAALPASVLGPDLTSVASRFSRRDLLEQIIDPSKIIDEKFRTTTLFLADGSDLSGTIESENATQLLLRPNPLSPDTITIPTRDIRRREHSKVSPMPAELLNTLTADQILDLLAWFEATGNPNHPAFKK